MQSQCTPRRTLDADRDFWPLLDRDGPIQAHCPEIGPCWVWLGKINEINGYGILWVGRTRYYIHRLAYTLANGTIPDGLHVLHHCDNRPCGRPSHLFAGTRSDNMRDMVAKGRRRANVSVGLASPLRVAHLPRGATHHKAKLTEDDVRAIRRRLDGGESAAKVAQDYPVSVTVIKHIRCGKTWKHVT